MVQAFYPTVPFPIDHIIAQQRGHRPEGDCQFRCVGEWQLPLWTAQAPVKPEVGDHEVTATAIRVAVYRSELVK
jgi:hypothetical protein